MDFKKEILELLKKEIKTKIELEVPPNPNFGDYALPCFSLTKKFKKNPNEIARELALKIKPNNVIKKIEAHGPYLNFFVDESVFVGQVLKKILDEKEKYGSAKIGKGKKVLIEHTSINPNASPHVGRARNALIGDSLIRIFKFQDYRPEIHYFVNDVGKQVAMLVAGCKGKIKFSNLLKIYIKINKEIKKNPAKEKEILELLYKLEKGDKKILKRFKDAVKICVDGQIKILKQLGIKYDVFDYESKYLWSKELPGILKKLEKTGKLFTDKDGRKVLNQEEYKLAMRSPVLVLTRSDGTSLYPLRDIAYNIEKLKKAKENIIVLGEDQKLYFEQIKSALDLLKLKAPKVVHYSFVLVAKGKKAMSTRTGTLVLLEDFMKEIEDKAKIELEKRKNKNKKLARTIGFAALKFGILKIAPEKNVLFNLDEALNFEGETGPYCQYAHARACSILRKAKIGKADFSLLNKKEEIKLIKKLGNFPNIVLEATSSLKSNLIANYVYDIAKSFNEFYTKHSVLKAGNKELANARLSLVKATTQVLKIGLNLLGIEAPEKM